MIIGCKSNENPYSLQIFMHLFFANKNLFFLVIEMKREKALYGNFTFSRTKRTDK